ncbi:hypothetical protein BH24CHL4_BH24CHL4_24150 [soil metagenome]
MASTYRRTENARTGTVARSTVVDLGIDPPTGKCK